MDFFALLRFGVKPLFPSGALLLLALCALPHGATAGDDYFPLQVGNQWVYRSGTSAILTLDVTRQASFGGRLYLRLRGLPTGEYWLRNDENGTLFAYDETVGEERLWYAFANPEGEQYVTAVPGVCCSLAVIASRKAVYSGPAGKFQNALEIQYPGVFQTGISRELFTPGVGLLYREQAAGPALIRWDLIYARVGTSTCIAEPGISFSLSLDRYIYSPNPQAWARARLLLPTMIARLTLRNTLADPLRLDFPTPQVFDVVLKNEQGLVVYQWSAGKMFPQVLHSETYGPGEQNYAIAAPLTDKAGNPLPPGAYSAEAWLTTAGSKVYGATASFRIDSGLREFRSTRGLLR